MTASPAVAVWACHAARSPCRVALALGALLFLGSSELAAQPTPPDSESARARELFERAVQLMESQDWNAALALLDASVRLRPTQVGLYDMGLCLKELGRTGEAIAAFERVVTEFADRGSAVRALRARAELQALRGSSGTVEVLVNVPGAEVLVDGAVVGTAPLPAPLVLGAGDHVIGARHTAHEPVHRAMTIVAGAAATAELVLRETPAPEPPPRAPPPREAPPPPDDERALRQRHAPPPRLDGGLRPLWFWSAAGLTGAAAVTTAVLAVVVVVGDADYRESRVRLSSDREEGKRLALLTDVALGVSIVAAVGTVLLWARTDFDDRPVARSARRPLRLRVSATLGRGLGSIAIGGDL
jgi:hypothetical protein